MLFLLIQIYSYKRLVENYWAPVSVSWGMDSRHSAVRVIAPPTTSASATRMEMVNKSHLIYLYAVSNILHREYQEQILILI
jgi:glutamine synthetase